MRYQVILIFFFSAFVPALTITTSALVSTIPYRIGSVTISQAQLSTNGSYYIQFDVAFSSSFNILPAALGVFGFGFLESLYKQKYFSQLTLQIIHKLREVSSFFSVILGPQNNYYTLMYINYFVGVANDPIVLSLYIVNNQNSLVSINSANQSNTYSQPFVPDSTLAMQNCPGILCIGPLQNLYNLLSGFSATTSNAGIGSVLYGNNNNAINYTNAQSKVFINKLNFSYTGPWSFYVSSQSNNISSLYLNVTYSNTITSPIYNCSIIIRNTSYSTTSLPFQFDNGQFLVSSTGTTSWALDPERTSIYYMIGFSQISMSTYNTNQYVDFIATNSGNYLISFYSLMSFNQFRFPIFSFGIKSCASSSYPYLFFSTQLCYDSCPYGYYSNSTKFCKKCSSPCVTCNQSQTNCTSCDISLKYVLSNNNCTLCQIGYYFHYDPSTPYCQVCPLGCTSCQNNTYCTSCNSSLKFLLNSNNLCILCPVGSYYQSNNTSPFCNICPLGCTSCQNSTYCSSCNYSLSYYLQSNFCYLCNLTSKFFNTNDNQCQNCSSGCITCTSSTNCILCDNSLQYQLSNGGCVICNDPQVFTKANKCQLIYQQTVTLNQTLNTLQICSQFNITNSQSTTAAGQSQQISEILQDYQIIFYINDIQEIYSSGSANSNNQICIEFSINQSITNCKLQLIYKNTSNTDRIINPHYVNTVTASYINTVQQNMYSALNQVIGGIVQNSGAGVSALVATSSFSLFIGFIEFAQITSLYMFTNAPIPYNLKLFLEIILQAQNCQLLPFQMPNPMQDNPLQVPGDPVYDNYQIDLYFMRGSLSTILQTITYIGIYTVLFLCLRWITSKNIVFRFFYKRVVQRFYTNCMMSIQAIQIVLVFSAAASATSRQFLSWQLLFNYTTSMIFILILVGSSMINIICLATYKQDQTLDTKDSYPGIQRKRRGAQLYTLLRILCLLCIGLAIPLIYYVYLIWMAVIFLILQLRCLIKYNLSKYRIQNWVRIIHTILFLVFNLMYQVYYIIDKYYPGLEEDIKLRIGNVSMVTLMGIYIGDIILTLIDIGDLIYQKITYLFCKKKKKKLDDLGTEAIIGQNIYSDNQNKTNTVKVHQLEEEDIQRTNVINRKSRRQIQIQKRKSRAKALKVRILQNNNEKLSNIKQQTEDVDGIQYIDIAKNASSEIYPIQEREPKRLRLSRRKRSQRQSKQFQKMKKNSSTMEILNTQEALFLPTTDRKAKYRISKMQNSQAN